MRRAVVERSLLALPASEAAPLIDEILEQAASGGAAARAAALALVSAVVHRRRAGDSEPLAAIAMAAREACLHWAALVCGDVSPARALSNRARLPEVGLNTEALFPSAPADWRTDYKGSLDMYALSEDKLRRMADIGLTFFGGALRPLRDLVRHPSGAFLGRVLRARWIRQADVLMAATRRPSTPEIAIAIAADDRWLQNPSVRAALAENPFTPRWLAAGLTVAGATGCPARRQSAKDSEPVSHDAP